MPEPQTVVVAKSWEDDMILLINVYDYRCVFMCVRERYQERDYVNAMLLG